MGQGGCTGCVRNCDRRAAAPPHTGRAGRRGFLFRRNTREKAVATTQRLLTEELLPKGIRVTHVLIRQYRYDQKYQQAIEQRKIQDQTVFKNQAEAVAAMAEAKKNKVIAEGAAAVEVELARGSAEVSNLESGAEAVARRTKAAEGELAVRLARARVRVEAEHAGAA